MVLQDQNHSIKSARSAAAGSSRSTSTPQNATMIGFDDVLLRMLDKAFRTVGRMFETDQPRSLIEGVLKLQQCERDGSWFKQSGTMGSHGLPALIPS
ncbi:putative late blight resistance protein R1B-16 isoform X2 [Salvia divinorum]|uniref:Late blight resistance protein R1B-16 isoform X2 n=1 Tax=Salvia divinorum TaxID=28513 RepID=A0ABD1H5K2_SALDI